MQQTYGRSPSKTVEGIRLATSPFSRSLNFDAVFQGREVASALLGANNEVQRLADEPAESLDTGQGDAGQSPLNWLPATLAAVALRLYSLDANLVYTEGGLPSRDVLLVIAWRIQDHFPLFTTNT